MFLSGEASLAITYMLIYFPRICFCESQPPGTVVMLHFSINRQPIPFSSGICSLESQTRILHLVLELTEPNLLVGAACTWTRPSEFFAMTMARYRPTWDLALDPLVSCKLCLGEFPVEQMTTIAQCQCIFCTMCLKQYVEILIKEGLETTISCPDSRCPKHGHLQEHEIECMVEVDIMEMYKKLQFEREVLLDPCRTWCPSSSCQAVCQLQEAGPLNPQLVQCNICDIEFCSACKANWHPGQGCPDNLPITFLPGEAGSVCKIEEDEVPIKRCPKCKVYIERDEGCAQMMCKNCKHAFCWYCLESLDDDFLLIHYDKGPCRNKLGHSRASVIWHRTQVVGIFAGFGLLLLVASPFLLLATPFVLCCKCKCSKGDDDPLPS
ncbi:E3 ubiquitin-protein ligase RNF144A [Ambystoma mexicanum]|uniref:E3 ubiquitin-protein ligase RNF144A n=1 Tax=Ambystoma mexicanum TaxID=8296 RepID=UPI0037E8A41B